MAYSVTVAPPDPEELRSEMGSLLDRALADLNPDGTPVQLDVVEGYPARLLMETAQRPDVDLVVTGSRGRGGVVGLMLGSVSQDLAVDCPKPLAIIPTPVDEWDPTGPVVAGVDGSPHGDQALRWAIAEAAVHHTSVRAVTAWSVRPVSLHPRYVG